MLKAEKINTGSELWNKAKTLIPGGNQLLSKRAEMFLPDQWPAYYRKAKGCEIWDLDNKHYYDLSIMGIGTCPLGYSHEDVNAAVIEAVQQGSMTTLNCPEEVELTERLLALHPWADMARYSRSGGEACAIAVRIARAFTQKDKVAICGYHGWHDWYLAANLSDHKNLNALLLPGLDPAGVPQNLVNTAVTFTYGDIASFQKVLEQHKNELGVIIMEVARHSAPDMKFMNTVREAATALNIVLIFDEVSSGFRLNTGGIHLLYDIQPDLVVLGKALGNGHPIAAVLGKREIMQAAQQTFISSSYWTERVGYAAALATLRVFERDAVPQKLIEKGKKIRAGLQAIFTREQLDFEMLGLDSVQIIAFKGEDRLVAKSVYTQEMLKAGFLAGNVIYVSLAHTDEIIEKFLNTASKVFKTIAQARQNGNLSSLLNGPVCHSGFKRLN